MIPCKERKIWKETLSKILFSFSANQNQPVPDAEDMAAARDLMIPWLLIRIIAPAWLPI